MGRYFKPPSKVVEVGRKIEGKNYFELIEQLKEDEILVGLYDRMIFMNAPHLYSENEYNEFQSQVRSGVILLVGFYAVDQENSKIYIR